MPCSPFQLKANRLNALNSTGPKTIDGKLRSRRNALKHGLTGAGVALPTEDVEAVQERFDDLEAELKPTSVLARVLIQRVAMFSIRLERCVRHETVYLSEKIRGASGRFDEDRATEVDRLFNYLAAEPAAVLRRLRGMPEGIERLISAWGDLRYDLIRDGGGYWTEFHRERAENLTGRYCESYRVSRIRALTSGLRGEQGMLEPADLEHGDAVIWCRDEMARLIDSEVEKLRDHLATLDRTALDHDRAEAADRALFDPSKEAVLARKYEAAAERGMFKSLDRIEEIRDRVVAPDLPEMPEDRPIPGPSGPETPPSSPRGSVASFFQTGPAAPRQSGSAPKPAAPAPSEPARDPGAGLPACAEPDPVRPARPTGRVRAD